MAGDRLCPRSVDELMNELFERGVSLYSVGELMLVERDEDGCVRRVVFDKVEIFVGFDDIDAKPLPRCECSCSCE